MSEDLGRLTDEDLGHLTDEDLERIAEQERADTDRKHGEHILAITGGADKSRDETTRSLLDAIGQARLAQEDKQT